MFYKILKYLSVILSVISLSYFPLSVCSGFATDQQINSMFPSSEFNIRDQYYTKKNSFSTPRLEVDKVVMALFSADSVKQEQLIGFLKYEANHGDPAAQEKVYQFLTKPFRGSISLVNTAQGQQILEKGQEQEYPWAFWQKAEELKTTQGCPNKWHFLAANRSHKTAVSLITDQYQEKWATYLTEIKQLISGKISKKNVQKYILEKVQSFVSKYVKLGYAKPLCELYPVLLPLSNHNVLRNGTYLLALQNAADLGDSKAQFQYASLLETNPEMQLQYNLKAARQGHKQATFNTIILLSGGYNAQPRDKRLALEFLLREAESGDIQALYNAGALIAKGFVDQPDLKRAYDLFLKSAQGGNTDAMYELGVLLRDGIEGQRPNPRKALQYFIAAAEKGHVMAMYNTAMELENGPPSDKKRALGFFISAGEQGHLDALCNAGALLTKGFEGQPSDVKRAYHLFYKAGMLGHMESLYNVSILLAKGFESQKPDEVGALDFALKASEKGHIDATYFAAWLLERRNHPSDQKRASELYMEAADRGHIAAMFSAANCFYYGRGQQVDKKRALQLSLNAAEKGHVKSMYNTGVLLQDGEAGDKKRALEWFSKAAQNGEVAAWVGSGNLLVEGFEGQEANKKSALEDYLNAAQQGDMLGMFVAGLLLNDGFDGQPSDKLQARDLFLQSAQKGYGRAMIQVALMYLDSPTQNQQDIQSALFWLEKAEALGEPMAKEYLEKARSTAAAKTTGATQQQVDEESDLHLQQLLKKSSEVATASSLQTPDLTILPKSLLPQPIPTDTSGIQHIVNTTQAPQESASESESEESSDDTSMTTPLPHLQYVQKTNNIKLLRHNLREVGLLDKARATQIRQQAILTLSKEEQLIADAILTRDTQMVNHNALMKLFNSPFFQGQVEVIRTKSGIAVSAFNRLTKQHATTGTHRKHNKSYKGAQPEFVKELAEILALFSVKQSVTL